MEYYEKKGENEVNIGIQITFKLVSKVLNHFFLFDCSKTLGSFVEFGLDGSKVKICSTNNLSPGTDLTDAMFIGFVNFNLPGRIAFANHVHPHGI